MKASLFLLPLFAVGLPALSPAGDAAFSRDGKHVYKTSFADSPELERKQLSDGTVKKVGLEPLLGKGGIAAVSRDNQGRILCAIGAVLWAWDDRENNAAKIFTLEDGWSIRDIAHDPVKDRTLIGAVGEVEDWPQPVYRLFVPGADGAKLVEVNTRRIDHISGMEFSRDGLLFFGTEGDLWVGQVHDEVYRRSSENPEEAARLAKLPPEIDVTLRAFRFGPLATRETQNATPGQTGVRAVTVTNEHVYAHVARMGGSGWGDVVRLSRPSVRLEKIDADAESDSHVDLPFGIAEYLEIYKRALGSVELLGDNGRLAYLCTSPVESRAYFEATPYEERGN